MLHNPANVTQDEERLGELAMQFRSTRDLAQRRMIAAEYADIVDRLVASGQWQHCPAPEDQLPVDFMPAAFLEHWSQG